MQLSPLFHVRYKRFGFSVHDRFLSSATEQDADIQYYIQSPDNVSNALNVFYTLLIDLAQDEETIRKGIYHRTRSEIMSFIRNQEFEHKVITNPTAAELNDFMNLFNEFAMAKRIRKAESFRLKAYRHHGLLALSYIRQNGYYLCINFYRVNIQRATNLYSFNLKHTRPAFNASHYGRGHRALHWLDILFFKKQGVAYYDFCGWYDGSEDQELLNINRFKEQFTTYKVKEYSGVIYRHPFLKFMKKLR